MAALTGCKKNNQHDMIIVSGGDKAETPEADTKETIVISEESENNPVTEEGISAQAVNNDMEDRLSYKTAEVYSQGEYYDIEISGAKLADGAAHEGCTEINGELYGNFRLDLIKDGKKTDSLELSILRDDRFLILESVAENLSYGCEIISNKKKYGSESYPDLMQLDFYIRGEGETPQYARYFAVNGGKLIEVPIYENGVEASPYGTHLEQESEGVMVQHLVVSKSNGEYTVIKYQYAFDTENMRLNRRRVKFYG